MNRILEIDLEDRTVTVQPGHQHAQALRGAAAARLHLSGQPGLVPVLARRRADRHERLVADRRPLRPHPRPGDQLRDRAADRRDHPGRRRRREEDAQVVERLPAQAPVHGPPGHARHRHRGDARAGDAARGRVLGVLLLPGLRGRVAGDRRRSPARAWPRSPASSSSTSGSSTTCAATTRRTSRSRTWVQGGRRDRDVRQRRTRCGRPRSACCGSAKTTGGELPRRRDLPGRLGVAPRPLRDAAARPGAQTGRSCR